ncbi:acetyltransferase YpeA [Oxobacter pfennigii]|uniref:Acetyltransferase YpeA n=1 Tax=Oxobacter pfennigii TaxID=36849 RepID=A0A0P8YRZ3_9CLOT|nr:GNAT family N-acetyltransferase [Oxobacter pfennigii]KPU42396.1 acetyltransferase YpeA [Oxobacter pfennigii]
MNIRLMTIDDYDKVFEMWTTTPGMGVRSMDDSREGINKFLLRNPSTNFVATVHEKIVGTIMCGHDGRRGYIYHTCVSDKHRKLKIGSSMVDAVLEALSKEGINKCALVVFSSNDTGNSFWQSLGWEKREDLNYYNKSINNDNM